MQKPPVERRLLSNAYLRLTLHIVEKKNTRQIICNNKILIGNILSFYLYTNNVISMTNSKSLDLSLSNIIIHSNIK